MIEIKETSNVIQLKSAALISPDLAVTMCIQNLMATFGEDKVRNSIQELFAIYANVDEKKSDDDMAKWIEETAKGSVSF